MPTKDELTRSGLIGAIDPGLTGAIAVSDPRSGDFKVYPMPVARQKVGKVIRKVLDEDAIVATIVLLTDAGVTDWFVEKVGGIRGQSASGAFNFGFGVGLIVAAIKTTPARLHRVPPQKWKGELNVPADKEQVRARANDLLPMIKHLWPLKGDDGKAEAALLALYGEGVVTGSRRGIARRKAASAFDPTKRNV